MSVKESECRRFSSCSTYLCSHCLFSHQDGATASILSGGDVLSAVVVFIGTYWLFNTKAFATINVALIAVWLVLLAVIGRHYKKFTWAEIKTAHDPIEETQPTENY